jgi:hypothetical protein
MLVPLKLENYVTLPNLRCLCDEKSIFTYRACKIMFRGKNMFLTIDLMTIMLSSLNYNIGFLLGTKNVTNFLWPVKCPHIMQLICGLEKVTNIMWFIKAHVESSQILSSSQLQALFILH